MRLAGKVCIVTGGASGFGAGIVRRFVAEGAQVCIADQNEEQGRELAAELGPSAGFIQTDVTSRMDVSNLVKTVLFDHDRIDLVINNAGYSHPNQSLLEVTEADFDKIYDVNVKAIFHMTQTIVPQFQSQGGGVMLNVASTAGLRPRPGLTWYNGSKGAVVTLTKSMAVELAPEKIRVNCLCPVAGETPMLPTFLGEDSEDKRASFRASIPLGRFSQPEDMASAALYLCSDEAAFITGVALEVDGGRCV